MIGNEMDDEPDEVVGVGIEELRDIEREQFDHYVSMVWATRGASAWPQLRYSLLRALNAAYGFDTIRVDRDRASEQRRVRDRMRAALSAIDATREAHDPATDREGFCSELWERTRLPER